MWIRLSNNSHICFRLICDKIQRPVCKFEFLGPLLFSFVNAENVGSSELIAEFKLR